MTDRPRIEFDVTARGFAVGRFVDLYGAACSVQSSSLATDEAVWCGMDKGDHVDGNCLARMHLNREQAAALAAVLNRFAETGRVAPETPRA